MTVTHRIRVAIAEDHLLVLDGIRKVIEEVCEVVGTAKNGRDAIKIAAEQSPEMMLIDIALPSLNGLDAARQIKRVNSSIRIIFVTIQMNRDYVREAFEAGASGYVLKQCASSELLTAIGEVAKGQFFLSSLIADRFLSGPPSPDDNPLKLFSALTRRQREVLQLVAEGKSAKEIASSLSISVKTVEFHKKHLMAELNLKSSADLIRYAVEKGFVSQ
jgi:DNA-binding NarL/FixJ family response regulator